MEPILPREKALNFLQDSIECGIFSPGKRLPSAKYLATQANVSEIAMWRALKILREKGRIIGTKRDGFRVAGSDTKTFQTLHLDTKQVPTPLYRWEVVKRQICADLLCGIYANDKPLPSMKHLRAIYGVSFLTLKRAFKQLCEEKIVRPYKKTFVLNPMPALHHKTKFMLIVKKMNIGLLFPFSPRHEEFIRTLEKEGLRRNIWFDIGYFERQGKQWFLTPPKRCLKSSYIGGIVVNFYSDPFERFEDFFSFILSLSDEKVPIACLDDNGVPINVKGTNLVKFFSIAYSSSSGKTVGNYLLNLGHRKIAYISPYHCNEWSVNRFNGLRQAIEDSGVGGEVIPFVFTNIINMYDYGHLQTFEWSGEFAQLTNYYTKLRNKYKPIFDDISLSLDMHLELIKARAMEKAGLTPLFEQALNNKAITVWVCANDYIAVAALDFLRSKGIDVPGKISIVGFDDSQVAYRTNITSCNFSVEKAARVMLSFILNPKEVGKYCSDVVTEIEAEVIERASTAKV